VAGSNEPLAGESGLKDTVIAYPGEITRVKARYDLAGFYVWHCHIVEHEDNEMMRPFHVGPIPSDAPAREQ
jgi:FtsP/CotA-like multicopper oxidase with cupredoxin domain